MHIPLDFSCDWSEWSGVNLQRRRLGADYPDQRAWRGLRWCSGMVPLMETTPWISSS